MRSESNIKLRRLGFTALFVAVAAPAWAHNYVGAQACGSCHTFEYQVWLQGPHARAHLSLTPEQQQDTRCTSCHSNAQLSGNEILPPESMVLHEPGAVQGSAARAAPVAQAGNVSFARDGNLLGVQCEACHGPGALYQPEYVMRDRELARLVGLVDPTPASCLACHNEGAPSLKPFNYKAAWSLIDHGREAREAYEAQLAAKAPPKLTPTAPSASKLEVDEAPNKRAGPTSNNPASQGRSQRRAHRSGAQHSNRSTD